MTGTKPRLLVACHDAGGAEVVSSWVQHHRDEWEIETTLDGPAIAVFDRKLGRLPKWTGDSSPDLVLCGTSATAKLEVFTMRMARIAECRCAAYLDHWTNYAQRFDQLPDEVWVCDIYAAQLADEELPGANIIVEGNWYLEDMTYEVRCAEHARLGLPRNGRRRILYVGEPDRALPASRVFRYLDREAAGMPWRIRPHPSVATSKRSLAQDIAWADVVVGYDTMALVVALKAGRRVISLLPASESNLPFPEIERPFQ